MKFTVRSLALGSTALLALATAFLPQSAKAAHEIAPAPQSTWDPLSGELTLGTGGTADRLTGSTEQTIPLWKGADQNDMIFFDGHWTGDSGHEQAFSTGLAYRHRVGGSDVIVGANMFWDHGIFHGQSFDQLGAGIEILSHWVDFRMNGYFPEGGDHVFEHHQESHRRVTTSSTTSQSTSVSDGPIQFPQNEGNPFFNRTTTITNTTTTRRLRNSRTEFCQNLETAMPGLDLELGFLLPWLDRYMETRVYGGYAYFQGRFMGDISAGTARLECRVVPAVIVDVEFKGDARLLDGRDNWFWGIRGEIPFDLGNLITGQSPFAGIVEAFTPRWSSHSEESTRNRMNENIIRAWRPQVDYSDCQPAGIVRSSRTTVTQDVTKTVSVQQIPAFLD
jgi:hypothetical protein